MAVNRRGTGARPRNAGGVPFLTLKGVFVVKSGQQPDGDTIRFAAGAKYQAGPVKASVPVDSSGEESLAMRMQSTDAPEKTQPMGAKSRDELLKHLGFTPKDLGLTETDFSANGMATVEGWIATHGQDGFERQLSYLYRKNPGFKHGQIVSAAEVGATLKESANYAMVLKGWTYPAFYENTDERHAVVFQGAAERASGKGVWAGDETMTGFEPTPAALGAGGALVYPKFYRRVEKWKNAKPDSEAFIEWLKKQKDGKKLVSGAEAKPVPLADLFVAVTPRRVAVPYDVTRLWFSE